MACSPSVNSPQQCDPLRLLFVIRPTDNLRWLAISPRGSCFQWAFLRQILGTAPLPLADDEFVGRMVESLLRGIEVDTTAGSAPEHTGEA